MHLEEAFQDKMLADVCLYFSYIVGKSANRSRYLVTGIDLDDVDDRPCRQELSVVSEAFKMLAGYYLHADPQMEWGSEKWTTVQSRDRIVQAGKQQMMDAHVVKWMNSLRMRF